MQNSNESENRTTARNVTRGQTKLPRRYSFWRNLSKNYRDALRRKSNRAKDGSASKSKSKKKKRRSDKKYHVSKLNEHHLTIDQMVARRKLEQLRLLTRTDLAVLNSAEPYRVSGYAIFKRNLLDPLLHFSVFFIYFLCKLLLVHQHHHQLSFLILFTFIFYLVNRHLESYRSFVVVERSVDKLSNDQELRKIFLSTHLGYNPRLRVRSEASIAQSRQQTVKLLASSSSHLDHKAATSTQQTNKDVDEPELALIDEQTRDSFRWINKIISFFWPYLSHLIHYELNEFFREKIESGQVSRDEGCFVQVFYQIIRQLDTNVLVIEKCQLGHQTPLIKNLAAYEGRVELPDAKQAPEKKKKSEKKRLFAKTVRSALSDLMSPRSERSNSSSITGGSTTSDTPRQEGKTLVYNLNLVYNGDMDISVIYRYFCCCNSRVGLKDVFLRFNIQVTLSPIRSELPFVDELQFTLLELPQFGYRGIALAELTEVKIVKRLINRLIREHLLQPRCVKVSLRELFETLVGGKQPAGGSRESAKQAATLKKEESSMSRIEPHPGKILTPSDKPVTLSKSQTAATPNQEAPAAREVSFWTRLQANALICGCMSVNFLLRCCQCGRRATIDRSKSSATTDDESNPSPTAAREHHLRSDQPPAETNHNHTKRHSSSVRHPKPPTPLDE